MYKILSDSVSFRPSVRPSVRDKILTFWKLAYTIPKCVPRGNSMSWVRFRCDWGQVINNWSPIIDYRFTISGRSWAQMVHSAWFDHQSTCNDQLSSFPMWLRLFDRSLITNNRLSISDQWPFLGPNGPFCLVLPPIDLHWRVEIISDVIDHCSPIIDNR